MDKLVNEEVRKQSSYLTSQVVSEAMQNVIKNKKWRERLHKGLQGLVRFTLDKGGKFLYKKGLKEIGLDKINLKNLLTILYFEYVMRIELGDEDDDPIFTRELEQILEVNLKEISEVCNEAKMI